MVIKQLEGFTTFQKFLKIIVMSHKIKNNLKQTCLFRLQTAILHYDENSNHEQASTMDGTKQVNITFPKHKGDYTVKKILVKCSYGKWPNKKELVSQLT